MKVLVAAASCRRIILMLAILAGMSCVLPAQTGTTSSPGPDAGSVPMGPPAPEPAPGETATMAPPVAALPAGTPAAAGPAVQSATNEAPIAVSEGLPGIAKSTLTALGSLGLVICLILVVFVLFRRYAPHYVTRRTGDRFLKLIETLPMGEKKSLALVQAGDRKLLLASAAGQIVLLTELPAASASASQDPAEPAGQETPANRALIFRKLFDLEKQAGPVRPAARSALPPDIRGKMQELRRALEV